MAFGIPSALQEDIVKKLEKDPKERESVNHCLIETLGLTYRDGGKKPDFRHLLHRWQMKFRDNEVDDLLKWAKVKELRRLEKIIAKWTENKGASSMFT